MKYLIIALVLTATATTALAQCRNWSCTRIGNQTHCTCTDVRGY